METREDIFNNSGNTSISLESGSEESELPIQLINSTQLKGNILASYSNKGIFIAQAVSPTLGQDAGLQKGLFGLATFLGTRGENIQRPVTKTNLPHSYLSFLPYINRMLILSWASGQPKETLHIPPFPATGCSHVIKF